MSEIDRHPYVVEAGVRTLRVLLVVADAATPLTLAEITRRSGVPKSSVFKYLRTLMSQGFVSHRPAEDKYTVGPAIWRLNNMRTRELTLVTVARDSLVALRDEFDETFTVGVLSGQEVVCLDSCESLKPLRVRILKQSRMPAYSSAIGRCQLAVLRPAMREMHLPKTLAQRTRQTVTDPAELDRELGRCADRGFAADRGENEPETWSIAAAAFDIDNSPIGAIAAMAPAFRMNAHKEKAVANAIIEQCREVERRLGMR